MGLLILLSAGVMDVFKGAAFKPPLRTSEEEYSLCSTALELDAPNRLQYSLYNII